MSLRIALLGNAMDTMLRFRGPLIRALKADGHAVIAICPDGAPGTAAALCALGARHQPLQNLSRNSLNPVSELRLLTELTELLRRVAPDCLFAYFLKPVIWGTIAARCARVPRCVGMIEGMGSAFSLPPDTVAARVRQRIARQSVLGLLRAALAKIDHLIVLNHDDAGLLSDRRLVAPERLSVLDGIGVDMAHYSPAPHHTSPIRFTLAARLIREKGVAIFAQAARRVQAEAPGVRFRLLGGLDTAPGGLGRAEIDAWVARGLIEWSGEVADVRPHLRETSVFVLPTLYREGLPRSIMEAMAMGRAVITSDMPGARDSVSQGTSGLIVPAGDVAALSDACLQFVREPGLIGGMGSAALVEAQQRYDVQHQNRRQISLITGN